MSEYIGSEHPYLDGPTASVLRLITAFAYRHEGSDGCCFHFRDEQQRLVVWFSKRRQQLEIGDEIRATFTVYRHEEYKGTCQNLVRKFSYEKVK